MRIAPPAVNHVALPLVCDGTRQYGVPAPFHTAGKFYENQLKSLRSECVPARFCFQKAQAVTVTGALVWNLIALQSVLFSCWAR